MEIQYTHTHTHTDPNFPSLVMLHCICLLVNISIGFQDEGLRCPHNSVAELGVRAVRREVPGRAGPQGPRHSEAVLSDPGTGFVRAGA